MEKLKDIEVQGVVPSLDPLCDDDDDDGLINDLGSGSDESEWGTVNGNFRIEDILKEDEVQGDDDEKQLYIPEPVVTLTSNRKPEIPRLPLELLPVGCHVWVVDEDDVQLLLREHWDDSYRAVCNGRLRGTVIRHSGNVTLVKFHDSHLEMSYSLSLPSSCLSNVPIEPYSRSSHSNRLLASCFGLGNLDPRAGRTFEINSSPKINRQFYESLSVMEIQIPQGFSKLTKAQEYLLEGLFEEAIRILDKELIKDVVHKVDILVLHSRANIFLSKYEEALKDALEVIELNPRWVKGYLAAARALSGLGKFAAATMHISRAMLLLPHSRELRKIEELNTFLLNLQMELPRNDLSLYLDYRYARQLMTCRRFKKNDIVYSEDRIVIAMESMFSTFSKRCCVCLKLSGEMMHVPVEINGIPSEELACYCSIECQQRSSLFFAMELGRHRIAVERARDLISSTCNIRSSHIPLDMACMTTRLFLMICVTHDRLSSQYQQQKRRRLNDCSNSNVSIEESNQSSTSDKGGPMPLQIALKHLGIYPLVTDQLSVRVREEMKVVYDTLTVFFSEEEKQMYSLPLFYALYEYIRTFTVCINVENGNNRLYYLPNLLGAVRRVEPSEANCIIVSDAIETDSVIDKNKEKEKGNDRARISLVAVRSIAAEEAISIPAWDSSILQ